MLLAVCLSGLFLVLFGLDELARRSRIFAWGFFLALPLLIVPIGGNAPECDAFAYVKLFTMLLTVWWLNALRFTQWKHQSVAFSLFVALPVLNVAEAIGDDALGGTVPHGLNAAAGVLVLATFFAHPLAITLAGPRGDLRWKGLSRTWIVAYSGWNWCFVYLNYPSIAGASIAILGMPLLVGLVDRDRWAQSRFHTLAAALILMYAWPALFTVRFGTADWSWPAGQRLAAMASLALALGCAARMLASGDSLRRGLRLPKIRLASPA